MTTGTVREAVRALMREWKLTTVFGNPGSTELAFLADWPDDFRYVLGLQESGVVAMADAYAQLTGNAALVNLHSSGGVGHGLGNVVTAFHNRAPVIVLAGQQSRSLLPGDPFLGALEPAEFPKPYVKWSHQPARAEDVPAAFARAYLLATQPPCGPVFLSVPADDWNRPVAPIQARPRIASFAPDVDALGEVAAALDASERPVLVVGAAVDGDNAVREVVELAEKTQAAVWAAPLSGRSSFPEDHPLFSGFLPPNRAGVSGALARYDCAVVLGAPVFTYHVVSEDGPELPPLYVLSDDPQVLARATKGIGVLTTQRAGIRRLAELVRESDRPAPAPRQLPPRLTDPAPGEPLSGAFVYQTLADLLPANAVVVEEAPTHRRDMQERLPITAPSGGFLTMASGVLGYGLPAAVGAALAEPARPVVAVLGDGGSMYGIQALWTAARQQAAVVFVILDNGEYGAVRKLALLGGAGKVPGIELGGLEFSDLARGMGCAARRVETAADLREGLEAALASTVPTLLHVVLT